MANCPKCKEHLKMTDWRQHCPYCGANIVVYDLQERLMQQADSAEVEYYGFQQKIDRVKASFVGSKLAIARIFTSILPIGAVFLPLVNGVCSAPLERYEGGISLLTIYNNFDKLGGDTLSALFKEPYAYSSKFLAASVVLLALSLVATLLHFILLTLSCSPKGKQRNMAMDIITLVCTVGAVIAFTRMSGTAAVTGSLSYGTYLYILLQLVNTAVDHLVMRQGIEIKHKDFFVGGIPIEEYFEMQKKGMTTQEIRVVQYERLQAIQDAKDAALREAEEKAALEEKAKKEAAAE